MSRSEEILRKHWPDLLAKGVVKPADPAHLAPEARRTKSAERLRRLPDGRVISFLKRCTDHGECMSRWAQECVRHYQLDSMEVLIVHPETVCPVCAQEMGVRWAGEEPRPEEPKGA